MRHKIKPIKDVLSDTGTIWEYLLFELGWNELPPESKYLELVGVYGLENGLEVMDLYSPALDITVKNVFFDEAEMYG